MSCWTHKSKCLYEPPEGEFGYVYLITNKKDGKIYVGKKQFTHATKAKLSKKVIKSLNTRKRVVRGTKDSGWLSYFGSSKALLADIQLLGESNFSREILCFCKNKSELTYMEIHWQIHKEVFFNPSYNGWIGGKVFKSKL